MLRIARLCSLLLILLTTGCIQSPYYQKTIAVPGNKWSADFKPAFTVDVEDTGVYYNLQFLIRHTNAYAYSNIWVWIYTKGPGDTSFARTRIEIPLADAQGRWLGTGMGEIWEQRRQITATDDGGILRKKGRYEIRFEQNMREHLLADVLHIGLRVEKGNKRNALTPQAGH